MSDQAPLRSQNAQARLKNALDKPLSIPPAILALNDVTTSSKMLLALYVADASTKNYRALRVLGVSPSGLKKIKRRLIAQGLLRLTVKGYEVVVPGLATTQAGEGGHIVAKSESPPNQEKVALTVRKIASLEEIMIECLGSIRESLDSPEGFYYETLLMVLRLTMGRIRSDVPEGRERENALVWLTARSNEFVACKFVSHHCPEKFHRKLGHLIYNAPPEQLSHLANLIGQGQLADKNPTLLLSYLAPEGTV
jgi:hypothetical protein